MRTIHRVRPHEKFVASGGYTWFDTVSRTPLKVTDQWNIYELPDGSQLVRVDYEDEHGVRLIEAWCSGDIIERVDYLAYQGMQRARASYAIQPFRVVIGRTLLTYQETERTLPPETLVYPPFTLFERYLLPTLAQTPRPVLVLPSRLLQSDTEQLIEQHSAAPDGCEPLDLNGQRLDTERYRYRGALTDTTVWLDARRIPVQVHGSALIRLTQYAHRPEPQK